MIKFDIQRDQIALLSTNLNSDAIRWRYFYMFVEIRCKMLAEAEKPGLSCQTITASNEARSWIDVHWSLALNLCFEAKYGGVGVDYASSDQSRVVTLVAVGWNISFCYSVAAWPSASCLHPSLHPSSSAICCANSHWPASKLFAHCFIIALIQKDIFLLLWQMALGPIQSCIWIFFWISWTFLKVFLGTQRSL